MHRLLTARLVAFRLASDILCAFFAAFPSRVPRLFSFGSYSSMPLALLRLYPLLYPAFVCIFFIFATFVWLAFVFEFARLFCPYYRHYANPCLNIFLLWLGFCAISTVFSRNNGLLILAHMHISGTSTTAF